LGYSEETRTCASPSPALPEFASIEGRVGELRKSRQFGVLRILEALLDGTIDALRRDHRPFRV